MGGVYNRNVKVGGNAWILYVVVYLRHSKVFFISTKLSLSLEGS